MEKIKMIQKIKLAEHYDAMATCMKAVTEQGAELSNAECNPLSVAYKNVGGGGGRRSALSRKPTALTRRCCWSRTIRRRWDLSSVRLHHGTGAAGQIFKSYCN
uniref:14-3-3 domain-containing protein n=1 Tax=Sphenodon punctatus TaxID=8508 RepID=A0A8D0H4Q1_SPHPU